MMKSLILATIGASTVASAFALPRWIKRAAYTDADVLNYALTLEHLEDKFYREGLANFTQQDFANAGYDTTFYQNLVEISHDETTHVNFLTSALTAAGASPVQECTYAFGITTVQAFVATAAVLEGVGVSAYLGAAGLISSKDYLTAAGSILTSESRHNAYLRASLHERPAPQPFDVPLDYDEVYTMASGFFVSCPKNQPGFLPVKAFPTISIAGAAPIKSGSTITLSTGLDMGMPFKIAGPSPYAAFVGASGPIFVPTVPHGDMLNWDVTIPAGVYGQTYVLLTGCNSTVSDDTVTAGPTIVEIQGSDGAPNTLP